MRVMGESLTPKLRISYYFLAKPLARVHMN